MTLVIEPFDPDRHDPETVARLIIEADPALTSLVMGPSEESIPRFRTAHMPHITLLKITRAASIAFLLCLYPNISQADGQSDSALDSHSVESNPANQSLVSRINRWRINWIESTDLWHQAGPAVSFVNVQDVHMSPLVYSGLGPGFLLGMDLERDRWYWIPKVTGHYARLQGTEVLSGVYRNYRGEADMALLYRLENRRISIGPTVNATINLREYSKLQNNAFNSDFLVSVSAALKWEMPFSIRDRSLKAHIRTDLPILTWLARSPAFALQDSAGFSLSPKEFFRTRWESSLTWSLRRSGDNTVRLSYAWDYYQVDLFEGLYPLRLATHTLTITLGTRLM